MAAKDHDAIYRRLFRHRSMVEDLLRRFVGGAWVDRLDFDTLELMPSHYVSEDLRDREDDRVWRLRIERDDSSGGDDDADRSWFYVYVVLEFQSSRRSFDWSRRRGPRTWHERLVESSSWWNRAGTSLACVRSSPFG